MLTDILKTAVVASIALLAPFSAQAACDPATSSVACLGSACDAFGKSQIDSDKQNLIICLPTASNKTDCSSAACQWKAMNGAGTEKSGGTCNPSSGASACVGLPCDTLGSTQMDTDKKTIVACLSKTANNANCASGACRWKPMGGDSWSFDKATWHNVTASRGGEYGSFPSTTFTNSYDHPIAVAISSTSAGSSSSGFTFYVNGAVVHSHYHGSIGETFGMIVVPAGATYKASGTMLWQWWELY